MFCEEVCSLKKSVAKRNCEAFCIFKAWLRLGRGASLCDFLKLRSLIPCSWDTLRRCSMREAMLLLRCIDCSKIGCCWAGSPGMAQTPLLFIKILFVLVECLSEHSILPPPINTSSLSKMLLRLTRPWIPGCDYLAISDS